MIDLHRAIDELNETQRAQVADFITSLLADEAEGQEAETEHDGDNGRNGRRKAAGHVELKMIGKCGPYAYLRYWEGGHLRSKYMGKVKEGA